MTSLAYGIAFPAVRGVLVPALAQWLPAADGVYASAFMDFTTEGGANHYYGGGQQYGSFDALWTALGGTFSRASTAYRTNASGLLESVGGGTLRFDHDGGGNPLGVLLEGPRTNLALYSDDFSQWTAFAGGTVTTDAAAAPDGNTTADTIAFASNQFRYGAQAGVGAGSYTYSVWLEGVAGEAVGQRFFDNGGGGEAKSLAVLAAGWNQYVVTAALTLGNSIDAGLEDRSSIVPGVTPGLTFQAWGAQIEAGAFPSSYIPTAAASAARAADALTRTRAALTMYSAVIRAITAPGVGSSPQTLWQADDGTADNRARVYRDASRHVRVNVTAGGVDQCDLDCGAVADETAFALAFRLGTNNFAASLEGASPVADTVGSVPAGLTVERMGDDEAGNAWFGRVTQHCEWDGRLVSDAALQALAA